MPSDTPSLPIDGRVIYLPAINAFKQSEGELKRGYSLFLSPIKGNENILETYGLSFELGPQRVKYLGEIARPLEYNQSEYYNLLKEGWVNYIVVNKNSGEIIEYFENSDYFKLYNETESFFIFETHPKSSYIEINNESIYNVELKKQNDNIFFNFTCETGTLKIKEGYHQNWNSELNSKEIKLNSNEYGFIETYINDTGLCSMKLSFSDPDYYIIFKIISLITLCVSISYLLIKK
jgi:hypothetical protein